MRMFSSLFQVDVVEDEQAGIPPVLYQCTDGVMRDGYARSKFEERVEWSWFGFVVRAKSTE